MRLRHTLRIINWSAAAVVLAVLIIGKEKDYAWILVVLLGAVSLHFVIETGALLRRGRYRRRLADTHEFREHVPYLVKDLDSALAADELVAGVTVPVILNGTVSGTAAATEKKAPLSGKKALAWRLAAEPLEGLGKVGGEVLPVDSWWGEMTLRDETGSVAVTGPGIVDGSSLVERVYSLGTLRSELPDLAPRIVDGLGIKEGKESRSTRIALREIALLPRDKVRVYGRAQRTGGALHVSGTDVLDAPDSLLVRAAVRPASSRLPRRLLPTIVFSAVSLALLALLAVFASSTFARTMSAPGGLFDASRTGKVSLDLDGRQLRVSVADSHWSFDKGDTTRGYALGADSGDFTASRSTHLLIQAVTPATTVVGNGDAGYPRWDGTAWVLDIGAVSGAGPAASATPSASASAPARRGALSIRNLTGSVVTIRVLGPDGQPTVDTTWSFAAYESADDPRGHYLELSGKGALSVAEDARVEIVTRRGARRILPIASAARWGTSSWLLELVPELLAGSGKLFVKNSSDMPVRVWLLGADGNALYGEDPWAFEPKEGATESRGLRLTWNDKDITMTGRESIRIERQDLATLYDGTVEKLGTWKKGAWTVDISRAGR